MYGTGSSAIPNRFRNSLWISCILFSTSAHFLLSETTMVTPPLSAMVQRARQARTGLPFCLQAHFRVISRLGLRANCYLHPLIAEERDFDICPFVCSEFCSAKW